MDWHDVPNPKHRRIVELYIEGKTLQQIANDDHVQYLSRNGFRIVARVLRRLRNEGYDIPRKLEFEGGIPTGLGKPAPSSGSGGHIASPNMGSSAVTGHGMGGAMGGGGRL